MPVPLILVSNSVKPIDTYHWEVDNDISPRIDYFEIAKTIGAETRGYENMGQCPQFTTCYCQQEYGNNYYWGHDGTMPLPHCIAKGE